jgi:hypothetical protein
LGRPEPVYVYSNGSRDGSITFCVLTDYGQSVDVGYDYTIDNNIPHVTKKVETFENSNFAVIETTDKENLEE